MAEKARFLERTGPVVHVQEVRTIGNDIKYQKQVGGFTIEESREYKDKQGQTKVAHDYITFDCEGNMMSQIPNIGDKVRVEFTIGGTFWKGGNKYFNKLRALKIETMEYAPKSGRPAQQRAQVRQEDMDFLDANQPEDGIDSLPF